MCASCKAAEPADETDDAPPPPPAKKAPKIRSRKELTRLTRPIGVFHRDYYLPALQKLAYHSHHVRMLGKDCCGQARLAAHKRKPSVRTRRDYAERLAAAFTLEIQSDHFGNGRSLSMEGSSVETFCKRAVDAWKNGVWQMDEADLRMVFHSHFSDDSRQDAATTHAHMTVLLNQLKEVGELCVGMTLYDDTDGCGKQYRCGTALYLLSVLACTFGIVIDRAIGAPGHGKDIVDGLNATDKVYLRKKMCMIGTPEAKDSECRMAAHSMIGDAKMSLADEAKRLCEDPKRVSGVKAEGGKRQKREAAAKMQQRIYHVQDPKDVKYTKTNRTAVGFEAGEHNGLLAHYSLHVSPELGLGYAALRRIPCACDACLRQLELEWQVGVAPEKQPRFASSTKCKFWPIFEDGAGKPGLNDWRIVKLVPNKKSAPEEEEEAFAEVLAGKTARIAEQIEIGNFGAFATLDEDADGYYLIKFTSKPYTLQAAVELKMYDPPIRIETGELVCDAEYFNKVPGASLWYTATAAQDAVTVVRVQQVVAADLKPAAISEENKLPIGMSKKNKADATKKKAVKISAEEHEVILDEICRREELEHEEEAPESEDEGEDEDKESSDEDEGEEDA